MTTNAELFERSCRVIPGGVNSSIRAFKAVGGTPYIVERAEGPYVWDVEGRRYIDLVQSYGAIILGHAHPAITAAVRAAAADGTSYGAPTPGEMLLAEAMTERVRSCNMVRLMNSGTEATSTAVRLARGFTGRDRLVIFHGNFHGATDALLAAGGSGVATLGLPGTAGVPAGAVANTMVVPYNVVPQLDEQVAAVIVEPVAANMGVVAPSPGFLEGLRAECDRVGVLLVFDEVITGFRLGSGGAQAEYDVLPDLTTFGKVIGGGLPIGAVGGRQEIMETLSPLGPVFHAGTLAGNPLATAAGRAALGELTDDVYVALRARARRLAAVLGDACTAAGIAAHFTVVGTLVGMYFGSGAPPTNFAEAKTTDERVYRTFFHAMLSEGVALAPGAYEALFVGLAHTDDVLDEIGAIAGRARPPPPLRNSVDLTSPAMRQFVSFRFWLAIAVLVGLTYGLWYLLVRKDDSVAVIGKPTTAEVTDHRINLVQPVYSIQAAPNFAMIEGVANGDMQLALDAARTMVVKAGTPGQISCSRLAEINQCVVAADLLGDAVVWFSLIPNPQRASLVLPGITEVHKDNWVLLSNGWEVARSEVVERNCDASGLENFVDQYGGSLSTSTFSYEQQEITKVTCLEKPEIPTTTSPTTTTLVPPVVIPIDTSVIPEEAVPEESVPAGTVAPDAVPPVTTTG